MNLSKFVIGTFFLIGTSVCVNAQTIGKTKTEDFKADFEKKKDISAYLDYEGPKKNIQILDTDKLQQKRKFLKK